MNTHKNKNPITTNIYPNFDLNLDCHSKERRDGLGGDGLGAMMALAVRNLLQELATIHCSKLLKKFRFNTID